MIKRILNIFPENPVADPGHRINHGLRAWWPLNEGAGGKVQDISTFGNHSSSLNTTWGIGKQDCKAAAFNGSSQRIIVPHKSSLAIINNISMSARVWMAGLSYRPFVCKNKSSNGWPAPYEWRVDALTARQVFLVGEGSHLYFQYSTTGVTGSIWNHIAVTFKLLSGISYAWCFYLNGKLDNTVIADANQMGDIGQDLQIGGRQDNGEWMNGRINDLRLWDRCVTAEEVRAIYENPTIGLLKTKQVVSYIPLSTVMFRKTFSQYGGRIGNRQPIMMGV